MGKSSGSKVAVDDRNRIRFAKSQGVPLSIIRRSLEPKPFPQVETGRPVALRQGQEVTNMRYLKIFGLAFMLSSFLPAALSARPQYPATTTVAWAAPDRDDWGGYYGRDGYYRYRDRDDRRYWRHRDRDERRWRRWHRDRDDWRWRHRDRDDYYWR
jgi:hypothetical protein